MKIGHGFMAPRKSSKVKMDGLESRRWLSAPASLTFDCAKEMKGSSLCARKLGPSLYLHGHIEGIKH